MTNAPSANWGPSNRLSWLGARREAWRRWVRDHLPQFVIVACILLFFIIYLWPNIFITIRAGEAGVLFRRFFGGTVTDYVYQEGLRVIPPWDRMTIYNVRVQEKQLEISVLTKDGLTIKVFFSVRYQPDEEVLGLLHKEVGPEYLRKIVIPEVEADLRGVVGSYTATQAYTTQGTLIQQVVQTTLERASQKYVQIDSVIIRRIQLPERIQVAIEEKLQQQQLAQAYDYILEKARREALRKQIEAEGIRRANDIMSGSLTPGVLRWKGIEATRELAASRNTKVVVIGNGAGGLPIILGAEGAAGGAR